MKYEIISVDLFNGRDFIIKRIDDSGNVWFIPQSQSNSDYQQYLIDTDGGLPIPDSETKAEN